MTVRYMQLRLRVKFNNARENHWKPLFALISVRILLKLLGRVCLGSIRNKNNWNNASKRLFGSYSYSGTPGFPFRLFCSQEQNSRNIFRNISNERTLRLLALDFFEAIVDLAFCFINYHLIAQFQTVKDQVRVCKLWDQ